MTAAPLRIGLLGASRIAELAVIDAARTSGDVVAAVAARNPVRAREYAAEHRIGRVHDSYEALLADPDLDLIYIGLPNGLHAEWAVKALAAGRNVLVEKPFAANLAEFDRVAEHMEASAAWAWEAFHYQDHPGIARALEVIDSDEVGEVRAIQVRMCMPAPAGDDPRWSFDLAGGALMDLGCYALHSLVLLSERLGAPIALETATAAGWPADPRVDAAATAKLRLGEIPVDLRTDMHSPEWDFSLRVAGERGEVLLPNFVKPQEDDRLLVRSGGGMREEHVGERSTYAYQLERIRTALRSGDRDPAELARSRRTMQLIDEITERAGLPLRPGSLDETETA